MKTRSLGRTDVRLSEITLGTWGLAEQSYGHVSPERFDLLLRAAIDAGVTTFDVAPLWGDGEAERRVGRAVAEAKIDATVVTRAGAARIDGKLWQSFTASDLIADCDASLARLGRDHVDVWLLHGPGEDVIRREEWREAVDRLDESGKIRAWGVSAGDAAEARMAITAGAQAICLPYHLLLPQELEDLATDIARAGCGVLARSPLAHGLLAGQWTASRVFAAADHRGRRWGQQAFETRLRQVEALRFLVGPDHPDLATAALRFVLTHPAVTTAMVGARSPAQVIAAVEAASGPPFLSDDDVLRLAKVREVEAI